MTLVVCAEVSKAYGRKPPVLNEVDFAFDRGMTVGLVGPNGSGKSTLMRMVLGLTHPTSGRLTVAGTTPGSFSASMNPVGAFLGVQGTHHGRTVRETARLSAYLSGMGRDVADERVEWSGLHSVASRRVGGLSLGMRTRLGIALATLRRPQLLVLDEPMNGLDVEGVAWVRRVIRDQAAHGGSTLVSSHLLRELQATVDRVLILSGGRLVRDVSERELRGASDITYVETENPCDFGLALAQRDWTVSREGTGHIVGAAAVDVARFAQSRGALVIELRPWAGSGLEELFVASTRGQFTPAGKIGAK